MYRKRVNVSQQDNSTHTESQRHISTESKRVIGKQKQIAKDKGVSHVTAVVIQRVK